jgi:glyoxylase-like metal-dependent hydrolase (beta-lactamase superfamily II)
MTSNEAEIVGTDRRMIGEISVVALSDGRIEGSLSMLRNIEQAKAERFLRAALQPVPPRISVNCYALGLRDSIVLIDTGAGTAMGPSLGRLHKSLQLAGIRPGDVTTVLLTHAHPDHSNGLTDASRHAYFPNAELVMHEDEVAHWFDDARMAQATPRRREDNFEAARRQIAPYKNQLRTFRSGEVIPNVRAVPLPGHTPGHCGYLIESGEESLLIWGDTVHIPDVQVPCPEASVSLDTDAIAAVATRKRVLDMAATESLLVAGMHMHFPGFARIVRHDGGFALATAETRQRRN